MVKLALFFKADLENVTDVGPGDDAYEWHFKAQNEISGSRGSANFVMRCKFCRRESSAQFDPKPTTFYTSDDSGKYAQMAVIECRGLEFTGFEPRVRMIGFKAVSSESRTVFENIDLSEGYWADYDENGGVPVSISEIEVEFRRS
ncbi:11030_t:CDS:2 [Paraglomus occultum]|uniref:11030_t:CDS:1 n=1 Tax=Paraglomus occultum TaxID=144539 RepID=A0A9N9B6V7_9GLOM|nr:11030_t:CDS:2 [Paraglomus occultum]